MAKPLEQVPGEQLRSIGNVCERSLPFTLEDDQFLESYLEPVVTSLLRKTNDPTNGSQGNIVGKHSGKKDKVEMEEAGIVTDLTMPHSLENAAPAMNDLRLISFVLLEKLQVELERIENCKFFTRVTDSTRWVNSLAIIVQTGSSKLQVCLDPCDLN